LADAGELRRRYLAQQIELGGPEVVMPVAGRRAAPGQAEARQVAASEPAGNLDASSEAAARPARLELVGTTAKWREGAPPIPGPGLTVVTGLPAMVGDPLGDAATLDALAALIAGCRQCALADTRSRTVPGEGNPAARLFLVGEGPGATEDATGRPFVGQAGQLLDKILDAIECPRPTTFIANIVKCRPPQNRKPLPDEAAACMPYLRRQIALISPKVIMALGGTAAETLLNTKRGLGDLRNQVHRYAGIPLIVTYHPAALLRNPNWKKPTWDDVRIARQLLDQ
jgi:DNA polymerase